VKRRQVKSTLRTFEILELFQAERRPMRLQEIYTALDYPQSSTTNLLKSMAYQGYLNYSRSTRTYLPTTKLSALGGWLPNVVHSNGRHQALVEELQRRTNQTAGIAAQNDLFLQYAVMRLPERLQKLQRDGRFMPPLEGSLRMMVDSAGGLALMSRMKDAEIDKICRYTNYYDLGGGGVRVDTAEVMKEINWIRHTGYCYRTGLPREDIASIAMPLARPLHGISLTIGVGGLDRELSKNRMEIVATMREILREFDEVADPDTDHPAT
jgi:DNA-binding IclR family transcriptional regulator